MGACTLVQTATQGCKQEQSDEITCVRAEKKIDLTNMILP